MSTDWKFEAITCLVFAGALAVMISIFVYAYREDKHEQRDIIEDGCTVVDERTTYVTTCFVVGKVTSCQPRPIFHETWECPDGRRFER
jgi:hypothetical protein